MEMGCPMGLAYRRIQEIEEEYDLLRYELDGWCVWPVLRLRVARALSNVTFAQREEIARSTLLTIAARDVVRLLASRKARFLIKTCSSARSEQQGALYKDIFFDDLLLDVGDFFKLEQLNSSAFLPRRKASLIRSNATSALFDVLAGLFARSGVPRVASRLAHSFSTDLREKAGLETVTPRAFAIGLGHFYWSKELYGLLLDRIRPDYLLTVDPCYYAITAAAKQRRITVVEMQHGVISRDDPGYSWSPYALEYKAKMPMPDRVFLYGEYWQQELQKGGFWSKELRPVGSPRVDQYRKQESGNRCSEQSECTILVTTQGIETDRLITFIVEFLEVARERLEIALVIKLHPIRETSKAKYVEALQKKGNVRVILGTEPPSTFELLSDMDFHVSISSACHYEALGLRVPTVILPFKLHELVLHLQETGYAFLARTPQDLLDIVLSYRHQEVPREVGDAFFAYDALENMKRELGI